MGFVCTALEVCLPPQETEKSVGQGRMRMLKYRGGGGGGSGKCRQAQILVLCVQLREPRALRGTAHTQKPLAIHTGHTKSLFRIHMIHNKQLFGIRTMQNTGTSASPQWKNVSC